VIAASRCLAWLQAIPLARERIKMKIVNITCGAALLCLLSGADSTFSQDAAQSPNPAPTNAPAGARRGRGNLGNVLQAGAREHIGVVKHHHAW